MECLGGKKTKTQTQACLVYCLEADVYILEIYFSYTTQHNETRPVWGVALKDQAKDGSWIVLLPRN